MKIVKIWGGLGNQMFGGALALALEETSNCQIFLDITHFEQHQTHQGFELQDIFGLDLPIATATQINELLGWKQSRLGKFLVDRKRFSFLRGSAYCKEDSSFLDKSVFETHHDCYFNGYWQSNGYFSHIEPKIRARFKFNRSMSFTNMNTVAQIKDSNAVSLHIRRGDYVNHPLHNLCPANYYLNAMLYLEKHVSNPSYFIFSDDIAWVRQNIKFKHNHYYIDHNNGSKSFYDMWIMSLCKHHIIANSSFSWWGAWLNPGVEKIVIAPKSWFKEDKFSTNYRIPQDWVRI